MFLIRPTLWAFISCQPVIAGLLPNSGNQLAKRRLSSVNQTAPEEIQRPHVLYDNNWAGAVLNATGVTSVSAQIVVGKAQMPTGGSPSTQYSTTTWVGIDGTVACDSFALLQTGISSYVQNGRVTYAAWYEWFPDSMYPFAGFAVNLGDVVRMSVTATSPTAGVASVQNLSTGRSVSHSFSGQDALCQNSAEWIVEDMGSFAGLLPFANFTTVLFTETTATVGGKRIVGNDGSEIYAIQTDSMRVRTECSTPSSSSVSCRFIS